MRERIEATPRALRRRVRHLVLGARAPRGGRGRSGARASCASAGHVYESEGAVWLRTTDFGDDKDRVLIRSDGEPTYFAADIAYHRDKLERGCERLIDVLGADHHGYVAAACGPRSRRSATTPSGFEAPIMQLVHIVEGGERAQMSKRKGEFVTLDELIDDIGVDATRFFMLQRSHDTTIDLDLDLARDAVAATTPSTTSSTRTPGSPASCARPGEERRCGGEAARRRPDGRRCGAARSRPSGRWSSGCSSFPDEVARGGRAPRPAPALRLRDGRSPPTSTPSTATARWSGRRARASRQRGWRSAW